MVNWDGLHDAALLVDRTENREATGRRVRAIDAILVVVMINLLGWRRTSLRLSAR